MSALPKATYTASLVTAGVLTARFDFSWVLWSTPSPKSCRHSSLPVLRSKQRVRRDFLSATFSCDVTKTRLPKTTGELVPQPGNFTDQRMFSVVLHRIESDRPSATPSAFGPLHRGQSVVGDCGSSAIAEAPKNTNTPPRNNGPNFISSPISVVQFGVPRRANWVCRASFTTARTKNDDAQIASL